MRSADRDKHEPELGTPEGDWQSWTWTRHSAASDWSNDAWAWTGWSTTWDSSWHSPHHRWSNPAEWAKEVDSASWLATQEADHRAAPEATVSPALGEPWQEVAGCSGSTEHEPRGTGVALRSKRAVWKQRRDERRGKAANDPDRSEQETGAPKDAVGSASATMQASARPVTAERSSQVDGGQEGLAMGVASPEGDSVGLLATYCQGLACDKLGHLTGCLLPRYDTVTTGRRKEILAKVTVPVASPAHATYFTPTSSDTPQEHQRAAVAAVAIQELRSRGQFRTGDERMAMEPARTCVVGPPMPDELVKELTPGQLQAGQELAWYTMLAAPTDLGLTSQYVLLEAHSLDIQRDPAALAIDLFPEGPAVKVVQGVMGWAEVPPAAHFILEQYSRNVREYCGIPLETAALPSLVAKLLPDPMWPLRREGIDWAEMGLVAIKGFEGSSKDEAPVAPWLSTAWRRLAWISRLRVLGNLAPMAPIPTPLRLEVVMGNRLGNLRAFQTLQILGASVLRLLFAITHYVSHPFGSASNLSEMTELALQEARLAALAQQAGILKEASSGPNTGTMEGKVAAETLQALMGAYAAERGGDYYSVLRMWEWICEGETDYTSANPGRAIRYLYGVTNTFDGRTFTYETYKETSIEGEIMLQVYYPDWGTIHYSRANPLRSRPQARERATSAGGQWKDIPYSLDAASFLSPHMWTPNASMDSMEQTPLPWKIAQWLRGAYLAALTLVKPYNGSSLLYTSLREMLDGTLHVEYVDYGWVQYRRDGEGGLGFEMRLDATGGCPPTPAAGYQPESLAYSEKQGEKTLLSPSFQDKPLPHRVTEWVSTSKYLLQLVTPQKGLGACMQVRREGARVSWVDQGVRWTCRRVLSYLSIVHVVGSDTQEEQELLFDGRSWRMYAPLKKDRGFLPKAVNTMLRQVILPEERQEMYLSYRSMGANLDWVPFPNYLRPSFPVLERTEVGLIELSLGLTFSNPLLLAEALVHASSQKEGIVPDCQRLAVVGAAVAEEIAIRILMSDPAAHVVPTVQRGEETGSSTYHIPLKDNIHFNGLVDWPRGNGKPNHLHETYEGVRLSWEWCCNHTAYAVTCVDLKLHLGMLLDSPALQKEIYDFARGVQSKEFQCKASRPALLAYWLEKGPPRALGDLFLACLGAMVLDGAKGYDAATKVMSAHIQNCGEPQLLPADARPEPFQLIPVRTMTDRTRALLLGQEGQGAGDQERARGARAGSSKDQARDSLSRDASGDSRLHTDLHGAWLDGQLRGGTSPRSLELGTRLIRSDAVGRTAFEPSMENRGEPEMVEMNRRLPILKHGTVFCPDCLMNVNSMDQYETHRLGDQHKENVCKQATPLSLEAVTQGGDLPIGSGATPANGGAASSQDMVSHSMERTSQAAFAQWAQAQETAEAVPQQEETVQQVSGPYQGIQDGTCVYEYDPYYDWGYQ